MMKIHSTQSYKKFVHFNEYNYNQPCEFTPSKYLQEQLKNIRYAKLITKSVALKPVDVFNEMDYDCEIPKLKISHIYQELIMV